ncbi:MAG: hypothetical protein ACE5D4_03190, partial [Thermodesulfobacteriota bacterium]
MNADRTTDRRVGLIVVRYPGTARIQHVDQTVAIVVDAVRALIDRRRWRVRLIVVRGRQTARVGREVGQTVAIVVDAVRALIDRRR